MKTIEELREHLALYGWDGATGIHRDAIRDAFDELATLRAKNAELVEALTAIQYGNGLGCSVCGVHEPTTRQPVSVHGAFCTIGRPLRQGPDPMKNIKKNRSGAALKLALAQKIGRRIDKCIERDCFVSHLCRGCSLRLLALLGVLVSP